MQLMEGDCSLLLNELKENSVDALITDPPAGISFMGKDWDSNKGGRDQWIPWLTEIMLKCWAVMKPGAHGLVWAIPRTSHWTALALENAGFEIRDIVTHLFGSGFPKSLDVSKAIDKSQGIERNVAKHTRVDTGFRFQAGGTESLPPATDLAKQWEGWGTALKPSNERWILCRKPLKGASEKTDTFNLLGWDECFLSIESSWKNIWGAVSPEPNTSTIKTMKGLITESRILKSLILGCIQDITIQAETSQNGLPFDASFAQKVLRDALGKLNDLSIISALGTVTNLADISKVLIERQQSIGAENLMEPFSEDIILIRKPLSEKTVAANVEKWGVGGINIDGCRVGTEPVPCQVSSTGTGFLSKGSPSLYPNKRVYQNSGRFPANLVLSHHPDCEDDWCVLWCPVRMLDAQGKKQGVHASGHARIGGAKNGDNNSMFAGNHSGNGSRYGDKGGASRFFYVAKASKSDRNAGLGGMPKKEAPSSGRTKPAPGRQSALGAPRENFHPTVKSTKLMEYLITLITPPGGTVLDCFMGSGSTGVAAKRKGFEFIGIEQNKEYLEIAKKRIEAACS